MSDRYRDDLPNMPRQVADLPVHRGYPVPWFVQWIEDGEPGEPGQGEPDFRVVDGRKMARAIREQRCWICGFPILHERGTFVIGPMCAINRISAEPPSHYACARFAAIACPFLARPHMARRESGKPAGIVDPAGKMIRRNPGVALVWTSKRYRLIQDGRGVLFDVGDPHRVTAYCQGREASEEEIRESIESGLPILREMVEEDGEDAEQELLEAREEAYRVLGVGSSLPAHSDTSEIT